MNRSHPPTLVMLALAIGSASPAAEPSSPETFTAEQRSHWAYLPLKRVEPPRTKRPIGSTNPIDAYVEAELESLGFGRNAEADRITLIRRVGLDLLGLPPTPLEVSAFLDDSRPDAYERLVDRLLESPRYGERSAQHWLDLAHYADTNGFELDVERPDAWRYRDWLISAFNADMPYDRFVRLQLAGDEVAPGDRDAAIATGFGRSGPREVVAGNIDPKVRRQSELTEITGTAGSVFLGLTMACARCHDHKFDAIPSADYYRLQAFFAGANLVDLPIASKEEQAVHKAAEKSIAEKTAPFRKKMADLEAPYRKTLEETKQKMLTPAERALLAVPEKDRSPAQKKLIEGLKNSLRITWEEVADAVRTNPRDFEAREKLKREIHEIEVTLPRPPAKITALVDESPKAPDTYVFRRGDVNQPGAKVDPRPPSIILASLPKDSFPAVLKPTEKTPGRRLALANWLTRPDNPLPPRVIVNRIWGRHFGRGIVATPSDFGVRGEPPTHPELLDRLALEFIEHGWSLKALHRLIVTSAAYRRSSETRPREAAEDPENTMLWRGPRRRMDAETLRDALLSVSGDLNLKVGGPGVLAPLEKEVEDLIFTEAEVVDLWPEATDLSERNRRSIYLFRKRNVRYPLMEAFDFPDMQTACPDRSVSTHALQALSLLNGDFPRERARSLAARLFRESEGDVDARIRRAYRLVLCRDPIPTEIAKAKRFITDQTSLIKQEQAKLDRPPGFPREVEPAEIASWIDFTLAMLNRNEFVYIR